MNPNVPSTYLNNTLQDRPRAPYLDPHVASLIYYVIGTALVILTGAVGIFTNVANICVYIKMGIKETTNMSFFTLSVFDLLVCKAIVVLRITSIETIATTKLPSGSIWLEVTFAAMFIAYPCLGCSAWVTAVLSVERYLCIAMPLKVKDILTLPRTRALILAMAVYQSVFLALFFFNPGPPYYISEYRRSLYFNCSYTGPTFVCFFIVSISTILLIIRLKRSLEWRNESSAQTSKELGNSKEKRATRSVLAICIIFIACFSLNLSAFFASVVYPDYNHLDPYLGGLFNSVYSFSVLLQVLSSSVNILVYYTISTKYREVFRSLFLRQTNKL